MDHKIAAWADEARNTGLEPTAAITAIAKRHKDEMTSEMVKRCAEHYNVQSFVELQKQGADMEQPFPLANGDQAAHESCASEVKKQASLHVEDLELDDRDFYKLAYYRDETPLDFGYKSTSTWKPVKMPDRVQVPVEPNHNATLKYAVEKCAEYIKRFRDNYAGNKTFVSELRYLYPQSQLLKTAGLDQGPKLVPAYESNDHIEFKQIEQVLQKVAAPNPKKKGSNPIDMLLGHYQAESAKNLNEISRNMMIPLRQLPAAPAALASFIGMNAPTGVNVDDQLSAYNDSYNAIEDLNKKKIDIAQVAVDRLIDAAKDYSSGKNITYEKLLTGAKQIGTNAINQENSTQEALKIVADKAKQDALHEWDKDYGWGTGTQRWIDRINTVSGNMKWLPQIWQKAWGGVSPIVTPAFDFLHDNFAPSIAGTALLSKFNPLNKLPDIIPQLNNEKLKEKYETDTKRTIEVIQKKTNFEDILANDDSLRGASPRVLMNIYESANMLAPAVMLNKEIARSILRTANAHGTGGLDPESAKMLVDLEIKYRNSQANLSDEMRAKQMMSMALR